MATIRPISILAVPSLTALLFAWPGGALQAQASASSPSVVSASMSSPAGDWVHLGIAYLDVSAQQGTEAGVEAAYRWEHPLLWRLHPQVGAAIFSDGSAYAYTGLALPLSLGARVSLAPSVAAGAFSAGDEVELGSVLEFRSALTLGVAVGRDHGVSLSLYHLSNAGLGDRNPGVEVLGITYWLRR